MAAFDDGTTAVLNSTALLGRNPSANEGETVEQLIDFADLGRSVSKTHLHLLVEGTGVWVTDRGSTNGSAITSPDGVETKLAAGEPMLASSGSQVSFGDRHFIVSRPV
ncbi:MAG: FHA domain-containing protein [Acidobacteria bacterium]|nr:FHA domain-containing protein [Acidobacteriota bacterium]